MNDDAVNRGPGDGPVGMNTDDELEGAESASRLMPRPTTQEVADDDLDGAYDPDFDDPDRTEEDEDNDENDDENIEASNEESIEDTNSRLGGGVIAGKALRDPLRHPTRYFQLLPRGTRLTVEMVDAIKMMGLENSALSCFGEEAADTRPAVPNIIREGPHLVRKLEMETRSIRMVRDGLIIAVAITLVFALGLRHIVLGTITLLILALLAGIHVYVSAIARRIESVAREIESARQVSKNGELLLRAERHKLGLGDF